jgi:hypothetical protein
MTQAFSGGDSQSKLAATQGMGQVVQLLKSNPKALTPQLRQQLLSFASGLTAFLRSTVEASTTAALWATARQTLADVNLVLGMS